MSNKVSYDTAIEIAKQYHSKGNLTFADRTYRDILSIVPNDFTSLHYLSIIAYQRGNPAEGLEFIKKAVMIRDDFPDSWNVYAVMLAQMKQNEEALEKWNAALRLKPEYPEALSNMGNTLWEMGRFEEARAACQRAVDIKPDFADVYINLGNALNSLGDKKAALAAWQKAILLKPRNANAHINIGNLLREEGKLIESEQHCRRALEYAPDHHIALLNLGNALRDQGRYNEAEAAFRQATTVQPNYVDAHNNLALLLIAQSRFQEAITSSRFVIAFEPNHPMAYSNLAMALRETGKLTEAENAARRALDINPEMPEAAIELADILFLSDRLSEAETLFNEAIEKLPDNPQLYIRLNAVYERLNKFDEALTAIQKAIELSPGMPEAYHRESMTYYISGHGEKALESIEKALELRPDFPMALAAKSEFLQSQGRSDEAREIVERGLALNDAVPALYYTLSKVKKFKKDDPEINKMLDLEEKIRNSGRAHEISLSYALAKAYEDIGENAAAFRYLKKANNLKRSTITHDATIQKMHFETTKKTFTPKLLNSFKGKGCESEIPVFIVGMPRSGTTLTEQIISSHPDVYGAGELHFFGEIEQHYQTLNANNCKNIGEDYIQRIKALSDKAACAKRITDKMPGNFMRIGHIACSLPNAKIIHCRRNPVDTSLSCYKQLFARGQNWSYDLDELAEYYGLYHDIMNHWHEVLPGKILNIQYEDTVRDFENQARKLIEFVGLEWNDSCLEPHKNKRDILTASKNQVTQPVYKSSVESWRRFEEDLAPFAEKVKNYVWS